MADKAAFDDRLKADILAPIHRIVVVGNDDIGASGKESSAADLVFGRIVAQHDLDEGDRLVLVDSEFAGDGVAPEAADKSIGLVRVDSRQAYGGEVAHLQGAASADHGGGVGGEDF